MWGENTGGGYGVSGSTSSSVGGPAAVFGNNFGGGPGVTGTSSTGNGIFASSSTGTAVFAQGGVTGVWGLSGASNGTALLGQASSPTGVDVLASNANGLGLKVVGAATFGGTTSFARSGKLTISPGSSQATKTGISLSSASLVLTTIQGNAAGVYVQGATTVTGTSGSFTVHLNKATPTALTVGWMIAN